VDRSARPDDGSPARLIAIMVGIVGILLLGSLAWSAVGALFSALGEATSSLSTGRPTPTRLTALVGTPTLPPAIVGPTQVATPGPRGTPTPLVRSSATPSPAETPAASALTPTPPAGASTPTPSGRAPWILLPQPAPDSKVAPGPVVIEARGRGDTPIASIKLDLDGVPLSVSLEQRSESTWRGVASTKVTSGHHAVRATVVDEEGRTGGFRWTFDAGP
jgi:hypothetical protein